MKSFFQFQLMLLVLILLLFFSNCQYDSLPILPSSNIILHDKPLDVIRANIQGHWKLLFARGGFAGGTYPAKHNQYMKITDDHIIYGDDSLGVTLDTTIVWKRDKDIFGDNTYLMSYRDSRDYPFPFYEIVDRIQNDTLIIIDDVSDPDYLFYLKTKQP